MTDHTVLSRTCLGGYLSDRSTNSQKHPKHLKAFILSFTSTDEHLWGRHHSVNGATWGTEQMCKSLDYWEESLSINQWASGKGKIYQADWWWGELWERAALPWVAREILSGRESLSWDLKGVRKWDMRIWRWWGKEMFLSIKEMDGTQSMHLKACKLIKNTPGAPADLTYSHVRQKLHNPGAGLFPGLMWSNTPWPGATKCGLSPRFAI